jgi:hypothetical protein
MKKKTKAEKIVKRMKVSWLYDIGNESLNGAVKVNETLKEAVNKHDNKFSKEGLQLVDTINKSGVVNIELQAIAFWILENVTHSFLTGKIIKERGSK